MKKEVGTFTGKTPEEAFAAALKELNGNAEAFSYEVLEKGKAGGFLGIGAVKAKILVFCEEEAVAAKKSEESAGKPVANQAPVKETAKKKPVAPVVRKDGEKTDGERAVEFLEGLMALLEVEATPVLEKEAERIEISLNTEKAHDVIGKRGVMLDAIQNLTGAVANIGRNEYKRVVVDCDGYREKRDGTLAHVARKTAEKAVRLGRKIRLEPMSAYERRIIHSTLADSTEVKTASSGKEPRRYVVVIPNELKEYDRKDRGDRYERGGKYNDRNRRGGRRDREVRPPVKKMRTYTEEEKAERSRVSGGTSSFVSGGESAYKKSSSIVFGTFLGNSRKNEEAEKENSEE